MYFVKNFIISGLVAVVFSTGSINANAYDVVGAYKIQPYNGDGIGVRYFAIAFYGGFDWNNIERAANFAITHVSRNNISHTRIGIHRTHGNFQRHLIVGFVDTNGGAHWTAARNVGRTNSEWVDCFRNTGFSNGWVVKSVRLSNGRRVRYQYGDDDQGGFVWEIKH